MDIAGVPSVDVAFRSTVDSVIGLGTDFFALIVLVAIIMAFAFYFGRDRLTALIAGMYAAVPLYLNFPYTSVFNGNPYLIVGYFVFCVVFAMIAFSGLAGYLSSDTASFFKTLGLSVLAAGLLLAIAINMLPIREIYTLSPATLALFTSNHAFFWWLLAPLFGVFFLGR